MQGKKEKKGKKKKDPTADRSIESLFAELVSNGILQVGRGGGNGCAVIRVGEGGCWIDPNEHVWRGLADANGNGSFRSCMLSLA